MTTKAVRLYGAKDLRLEDFELPPLQDDEILAKVVTDSLCMSTYKAASLGASHKRIPNNVSENPIIIGHEFSGEIVQVGSKWKHDFSKGEKFAIQPALSYQGKLDAPGYSFSYIGGDATYIIIPSMVMEQGCLLKSENDAFFLSSLSEPVSCVIGTCNAMYHIPQGTYNHVMGLKKRSNMAIMAGTGPMGIAAIDYCLNGSNPPALLVVTSRNKEKLAKLESLHTIDRAKIRGVRLIYLHIVENGDSVSSLLDINPQGYDDVIVMAPSQSLVMVADKILTKDGCLNFFAGPTDTEFSAPINFYNVHYSFTHLANNSGGNVDDMKEALELMAKKIINPASLVSHIGGLNAVIDTTLNLPNIAGSKKLIYTHKDIALTDLNDLQQKGEVENSKFFKDLAHIVQNNKGTWSTEAENYVLLHAKDI